MIPQGWQEKTLGEVCIVERGSSPRPIKNFITDDGSGVNWIKIGDCSGKYVTSTAQKITEEGAKKSRYVKKGDFVISNSMSYGKPYILKIDGYIHDGWFVLRLNKNLVNADYFYYLLSSNYIKEQYDALATGAIVQNISSDLIKRVQFNLPPLPEQERIVAKLDEAFEAIDKVKANAEQNLNNAKELYKVVLNKVFNSNKYQFEHIKLDDLCEIITDGTHQTPTYADKGVIFLSAKNVTSEVIDWENIKYIPDNLHNELKKRVSPQKGDILLAKNGTTGVAAIVDRDCVFDIYVSLCMLRPKKTVNVQYLLLAINNPITKDKFNKSLIGIGVPNLHLNKIRETTVPIPSPKFQDEISSLLNGLKAEYLKLEQIYIKKIKECDELKQSILQKAFRGEL